MMTEQPARSGRGAATPAERVTSMCLQIAGFDHDDCPGGSCTCGCHKEES